jgi:hypothetical protein
MAKRSRTTDPKERRPRRELQPPKLDPNGVQAGEILDLCVGPPPPGIPFIRVDNTVFVPRRGGQPVHQPLSMPLARSRVGCK